MCGVERKVSMDDREWMVRWYGPAVPAVVGSGLAGARSGSSAGLGSVTFALFGLFYSPRPLGISPGDGDALQSKVP